MGIKILVLQSYNIFIENSALSNRWRTIVEGLSGKDCLIHIFFTSGYRSKSEKEQYGRRGFIDDKIEYTYLSKQNRYSYLGGRINLYLLSWWYNRINSVHLRRITKKLKPDIVFLNTSLDAMHTFSLAFRSYARNFKLMIEVNEFNDIWDIHMTNWLQKWRNKKSNDLLLKVILPRLSICLVMTDTLMEHYKGMPGINPDAEFLKIPMTVDLSRFENTQANDTYKKPYIAYCGSGGFYANGVDILIKSFARISHLFPEIRLYIAAFHGNDESKMLGLIKENKLSEKAIYLGVLNRNEIPSFLAGAELLALPRPDSRQARGGFPTKLGEYLASGSPVCVTRVGEIPQYLADNESAFMADPGDEVSFAKAMERCLRDPVNAKRVADNGKQVAHITFNMEYQTDRLFSFLEQRV